MSRQLLTEELWQKIEPLLPPPKRRRRRYPGRKPISHRQALTGILFVLKSGIPWEYLPKEMNCGSGMTCWRRLRDWHRAGVWKRLHEVLLAELQHADQIDWSKAVVDSASVRAPSGGKKTGPNPVDRRKLGVKHHVIVDANGIPLALVLTAANRHDVTQLMPLVEAIPQVRGKVGRPRHRPRSVYGDRAYDSEPHRKDLKKNRHKTIPGQASHAAWKRAG